MAERSGAEAPRAHATPAQRRRAARKRYRLAPPPSHTPAAPELPQGEAAVLDALRALAAQSPEARQLLEEIQVQLEDLRSLQRLRRLA